MPQITLLLLGAAVIVGLWLGYRSSSGRSTRSVGYPFSGDTMVLVFPIKALERNKPKEFIEQFYGRANYKDEFKNE